MTRQEFIETITSWDELLDFCSNVDCSICEDIYDEDARDEIINDGIRDTDYSWSELRDVLNDIPTGDEYYRCDGWCDWEGLGDDDFCGYKDEVCAWVDGNDLWEDDEDEDHVEDPWGNDTTEEQFEGEDDDTAPIVADEEFSVGDLMRMCSVDFALADKDRIQNEKESANAFARFVGMNTPNVLK